MWNNLPVAHQQSLQGASRFHVLGFTAFITGFVAARSNDGAKSTSFPLPLFCHDCCTNRGPLPVSMEIHQWHKLLGCLGDTADGLAVGQPRSPRKSLPMKLYSHIPHISPFFRLLTPNDCLLFILCSSDYLHDCWFLNQITLFCFRLFRGVGDADLLEA